MRLLWVMDGKLFWVLIQRSAWKMTWAAFAVVVSMSGVTEAPFNNSTKWFCLFIELDFNEKAKLLLGHCTTFSVNSITHLKWFLEVALIFFYRSKYVILCVYMCLNICVYRLYVSCFLLTSKGIIISSNLLLLRHSDCICEWGVTMVTVSLEQRNKLIMVLWEINALSEAQQQSWSIKLRPSYVI